MVEQRDGKYFATTDDGQQCEIQVIGADRPPAEPPTALDERLAQALIGHDWTYAYSDDHQVYLRGAACRRRIFEMVSELPTPVAREIWEDHAPEWVPFPERRTA